MKRFSFSWLVPVMLSAVAYAEEVRWDFSDVPNGSVPPGWVKPDLGFPTEGWYVQGGHLIPIGGANTYAVIQTPPLRFVADSSGAGQSAGSSSSAPSSGHGASDVTAEFQIDDLDVFADGASDTVLMELIRLDQASAIVHTFIEAYSDYINVGSFTEVLTSPVIEGDGTYSVRFTAYDYDGEYTVDAAVSDLRISNAILADAPLLPGDFNGNGAVENADLTLLLNHWGNAVPPTPAGWIGSPLTAPTIDNDELTALLNNWGTSLPGGAALSHAAVPEPASLAMLGFGLALLGPIRHRPPTEEHARRRGQ